MRFPNKETVERIRREYPAGARVELVRMEDVQAPPVGTKGTVLGVDDTGSLLMRWDTGSGLNVVYGEDIVKKLATVTTVCYGEKKVWDSRKEAADFFLQAIAGTEGAECERYTTIYTKLVSGLEVCSDDADD
ncbi:MAG TPA: DUF4314 domain-containing protein [Spirochaetia bacterium]|jgi:hypothetical protein|nr:DUF4314 domain-containing protein [Eubacteriales bacterium]HPR89991.1 DUF4314 domain-containing protein [Synergistaceae bacterium]HQH66184.1 DUF4314 domain-containing protein [Clostridia bacterium]HQK35319.1 DUF4314 domain-containing protein [Spirochaetales bacterium]HRS64753.1 DUF4314 domain-containing protein [Spirochaetia bacterium]